MTDESIYKEVESLTGYHFTNRELLEESITHPSVTRQRDSGKIVNYERLEFLGDAVLGLVVAEMLVRRYPLDQEGPLAKRQAALVRGEEVANVARKLGINHIIKMTQGEEAMGGRENDNNIENCLEAIIGAVYKDGGLDPAKAFIVKHWAPLVDAMKEPPKDTKTALQEWSQSRKLPVPEYTVAEITGPSHAPIFTIKVSINGFEPQYATGPTKKKAEKDAAKALLAIVLSDANDN